MGKYQNGVNSLLFTQDTLQRIKLPQSKKDVYKDTKEMGLSLVVSCGGSKTFYFGKKFGKIYHRIKIGRFPDLSVAEVREKVKKLKNDIANGVNPIEEKVKLKNNDTTEELTFEELLDKYINDYARYNMKRWKDYQDAMRRHAKIFYPTKITNISTLEVQNKFNELSRESGTYAANRFIDMFKSILNKAIEWKFLKVNPAIGIKKHKEESRERYLTREEFPRFIAALDEEQNQEMRDFFLIALYTAVRKENILNMRWEQISFVDKIWYIPDTKNGKPHSVILSHQALEVLERRNSNRTGSAWVFPSEKSSTGHLKEPKSAIKRICKRAKMEDFRIHDLRRTIPSWMAMNGANQYMIATVLNHTDPRSTIVYARLSTSAVRVSMQDAINDVICRKNEKRKPCPFCGMK